MFAAKGFEGASTREIAAGAGVNISSLHYHWDSKETLYRAVFERIYSQLGSLLEDVVVGPRAAGGRRETIRVAMGLIFDYYAANPTVPRLLMRRIVDSDGSDEESERDLLGSHWETFAQWVRQFTDDALPDADVSFFMLTVQSVLLVLMLGSPHVAAMLGGKVHDPRMREGLRRQVIALVERLVGVPGRAGERGGAKEGP